MILRFIYKVLDSGVFPLKVNTVLSFAQQTVILKLLEGLVKFKIKSWSIQDKLLVKDKLWHINLREKMDKETRDKVNDSYLQKKWS